MGACGELRDELHACQLLPISINETDQETLEYKRAHAARTGDHQCVVLNGQSYYINFTIHNPHILFDASLQLG